MDVLNFIMDVLIFRIKIIDVHGFQKNVIMWILMFLFFYNAFEIYTIQTGIELHVDIADNAVFIYLLSTIQLDAILI